MGKIKRERTKRKTITGTKKKVNHQRKKIIVHHHKEKLAEISK